MVVYVWLRVCGSAGFGRLPLALLERLALTGPDGPLLQRTGPRPSCGRSGRRAAASPGQPPGRPQHATSSHSTDCGQVVSRCVVHQVVVGSSVVEVAVAVPVVDQYQTKDTTKPKPQRISPETKEIGQLYKAALTYFNLT